MYTGIELYRTIREIYTYAQDEELISYTINLSATDKLEKHIEKHYPAIIDPVAFGGLLRAIRGYAGDVAIKHGLLLSAIFFVRPSELRLAKWSEFDLTKNEWQIPAKRMKRDKQGKATGSPHFVPVPKQAAAMLKALKAHQDALDVSKYGLVFPSPIKRGKSLSDGAFRAALGSLGYGEVQSVHGFRASGRTMVREQLGFEKEHIEAQLDHAVEDANGRAYNRTQFYSQRKKMLQAWADYLDKLAAGLVVVKPEDSTAVA